MKKSRLHHFLNTCVRFRTRACRFVSALTEIAEVSPKRDEKRRPPNETRSMNSVVPDSRRHLARAAFREEMSSAVNGGDREREREVRKVILSGL